MVEYRLEVMCKLDFIKYICNPMIISLLNDVLMVQELSTAQDVTVTLEQGDTFCSTTGSVTKIEYLLPQGDVPDLEFTQSTTFDATITLFTGGSASVLLV